MTPQDIANDITEIEVDILRTQKRLAKLSFQIDAVARDLNGSGVKVRACEAGDVHSLLTAAYVHQADSLKSTFAAHCAMIKIADESAISLPKPQIGGR